MRFRQRRKRGGRIQGKKRKERGGKSDKYWMPSVRSLAPHSLFFLARIERPAKGGKSAGAMRTCPRPRARLPSRLLLLRRATVVISDNSSDPRRRIGRVETAPASYLLRPSWRVAPIASRTSDNIRAASVMRERSSASVILQEVRDSLLPTYLPIHLPAYLATYLLLLPAIITT